MEEEKDFVLEDDKGACPTDIDITRDDMDKQQKVSSFQLGDCPLMELLWKRLVITATVAVPTQQPDGSSKEIQTQKILLNRIMGVLRPKHFTAIMGPSGISITFEILGSGKTTLMNFLAGRLVSPNLQMTGELYLNGQRLDSLHDYANRIGYVTQDDILLATMTPLEAFWFTANLKLQMSQESKQKRIQILIKDLRLGKCANTRIGNEMKRGVSGGERKRVSIGVELLVDPSLLFLDEPTTGLDSSTALQVIDLLVELGNSGRTVVSSIHQPSSEIFARFDYFLLIVRGSIIFQGPSRDAIQYFQNQGFPCPKFNNPTDYFMKLMNEEGLLVDKIIGDGSYNQSSEQIKKDFQQRVDTLVQSYKKSEYYRKIVPKEDTEVPKSISKYQAAWHTQFFEILYRTFVNQMRNPVDVQIKLFQFLFYAILIDMVFYNLGTGLDKVQNTTGMLFFQTTVVCFATMNSTLAVFGSQRALYLKERYNYYYSVGAYFWGRSLAELPVQMLYAIIMVTVTYFAVGLSLDPWTKYPTLIIILSSSVWHGTSYGLLASVLIPKIEIAMAVMPTVGLLFFSTAGYFTTGDTIPYPLYPFRYLNLYKYAFEAGIMNEFSNQQIDCNGAICDPLEQYNIIWTSVWIPILINYALGLGVRIVALLGLYWISRPKMMRLNKTEGESI